MVYVKSAKKNNCHDCGKKIRVSKGQIEKGVFLKYDTGEGVFEVLKCADCFNKSKHLTNFRRCEVYSRVCGYLRPVHQWNVGKQREFNERKDYVYKY